MKKTLPTARNGIGIKVNKAKSGWITKSRIATPIRIRMLVEKLGDRVGNQGLQWAVSLTTRLISWPVCLSW
jgi:hypothetical protein